MRQGDVLFGVLMVVLVVAVGLALLGAGRVDAEAPPAASVWGVVEPYKPGGMCGRGLDAYVAPCEGCVVWVDWQGNEPDVWAGRPFRLDGLVVDDFGTECQVLEVENWVGCAGGPVGLSSESIR